MAISRGCFWIATMGAAHMICGIGKNQRQAIQNAMQQIGGNEFTPVMFDCIRCTPELYAVIDQRGAMDLSWELDASGVAQLAGGYA